MQVCFYTQYVVVPGRNPLCNSIELLHSKYCSTEFPSRVELILAAQMQEYLTRLHSVPCMSPALITKVLRYNASNVVTRSRYATI